MVGDGMDGARSKRFWQSCVPPSAEAAVAQRKEHIQNAARAISAVALQRAFRRRKGKWRSMVLRDFATVVEAAVAQRKEWETEFAQTAGADGLERPAFVIKRACGAHRVQAGQLWLRLTKLTNTTEHATMDWEIFKAICEAFMQGDTRANSFFGEPEAPTEVWTSPLRGFNDAQQRPRQIRLSHAELQAVLASVKFAKEDVEQGLCNSLTNALAIRLVISMGDLSGPVLAALVQNCADGSLDKVVNFSRQTLRAVIEDFEGEPFLKKQLALFVHPDKTQHPCAKDAFQKLSM